MSIVLQNASYNYMPGTPYERHALKNINLEIKKGEFVGVIGHTGSGKSTLMQHFNGLLKPTSGKILVENTNINDKTNEAKKIRHKVGMVFQYPEHQLFEETIFADIAFGPRNMAVGEDEILERVRFAMDFVGLDYDTFAQRSPFQLSGGQMRRVAIAGVIAIKPSYLILDEPSAGLDPRGRNEIFTQIYNLYKATGITVVLVSHNMEEVARLVTRLIVMDKGQIALDGSPREVFSTWKEKLNDAGVDVPHVTSLLSYLKEQGLSVEGKALTVESATSEIFEALRRQGTC